jgi:alpha-galactosidase
LDEERWCYLRGGEASLLIDMAPAGGGLPRIVHFGPDLGSDPKFEMIAAAAPAPLWGARLDVPCPPCILPGLEGGYFGTPALSPAHAQGWSFDGVEEDDEGLTLRLVMQGRQATAIEIDIRLSDDGVLQTRTRASDLPDGLSWLAALALPLPHWAHEILSFGGDWAREFALQRQTLGNGTLLLESRRGRPGHDRYPALIAGAPGFAEDSGGVFAVTLGWSGSHRLSVERLREGEVIVQAGELMPDGDLVDDVYESPWAYAVFSARGLNGVMQALHAFARRKLLPASVARKPRLVHLNTWEAVYFEHDLDALRALATRGAELGVERFVLDDGWFKGRANDRAGLGDWIADRRKFPDGLAPLIDHVRGLGLEFGLWVEPEMVNPDSDLARTHPHWLRREADGALLLQRNQAVLDLAEPEIVEHLFDALRTLLAAHAISYLKWDMNRDLTGVSRAALPGHGAYVHALYDLIDRLRAAHPDVEIEACASGGGRADWGMLERAERIWTSDSNDALDRFEIQRNALLVMPPEVLGAHVGPAACHITGRRLSLDLRAHVAMFGHMGLELDLRSLSDGEAARLRSHVANYKRFRSLLHSGRVWRMTLNDSDHSALGVTGVDKRQGLYLLVRRGSQELGRGSNLRFPGLSADGKYRVSPVAPVSPSAEQSLSPALRKGELVLSGTVLRGRGLDLFLPRPESSLLLHVERV